MSLKYTKRAKCLNTFGAHCSLINSRFGRPVVYPPTRAHKTAGNQGTSFSEKERALGTRLEIEPTGKPIQIFTDSNFHLFA